MAEEKKKSGIDTTNDLAMAEISRQRHVTAQGNPANPTGDAGFEMLKRMNESHYKMTGWGLSFLALNPDAQLLDIGCGGGMTLHRLSDGIKTGHLTGVDYSSVSVEASKKLNEADLVSGKMSIDEASVEALPYEDNSFDVITTVESFYFWPNPQESLKEVYRVLKPEGQFLLISEVYNHEGLTEEQRANIAAYKMNNPTMDEFEKLFAAAGFEKTVIHIHSKEGWIAIEGKKD